jgi:hypothetical protein
LTTAIKYAAKVLAPDSAFATNLNVKTWIAESWEDSKTDVYISPIGPGDGPFKITSEYQTAGYKLAQERVALAGMRLAAVLKEDLK